ncbi:probable lipase Mil1p [Trichomonascus vanleenenianus]|uniref:putative lipase Mil1p n=1 Tax=Trichomonascus vanleenenianus TaxID=2268995 RepID=UPI003EC9C246
MKHSASNSRAVLRDLEPLPSSPLGAGTREATPESEGFDEFNAEEDILEFRLRQDDSIMKSGDNNDRALPTVIQHSNLNQSTGSLKRLVESRDSPVEELFGAQVPHGNEDQGKGKVVSGSSHQRTLKSAFWDLGKQHDHGPEPDPEEQEWQDMKTVGSYEIYDDRGKVVVHKNEDVAEEEELTTTGAVMASKGYTRLADDEDTKSVNSIDEKADFLFDEDEYNRNPLDQLQATKNMLTDAQRIAYVGLCKVVMMRMTRELSHLKASRKAMKSLASSMESMNMWAQQMMIRLYAHMDLSPAEQIMIEQLFEHGVMPEDLTPSLMESAKVKNPVAKPAASVRSSRAASMRSSRPASVRSTSVSSTEKVADSDDAPTEESEEEERIYAQDLEIKRPEDIENEKTLSIDIRWTLLCDLFLVLISDSTYDSRSRSFLQNVAAALDVTDLEICQFERKVTDALEIEEGSEQVWDESDIMEDRRKKALKKKYMYVGLATLGGGLVIGLSAGLLAPVIGAGLAAGFTTIGITGTSGFLAGAGGAAVVTTTGAAVGAHIGSKGMSIRMGHVRTFEFRPLHNNRRVNTIVTVSGWMSGKEDDVRLPFSTVDPIMGDLFSVLWEPEMLQSMGQTINILATEVLVQSIQQVLGQTVLTALMASIQLPMVLAKLSYLLDNPWNVSLDRAWSAGLILADSLIKRNLGVRPVTLVGFSLGARLIYSCLVELARRGAYGLVQDVYIFGAPVVVKRDQFAVARSVVSGRFVNGFSRKDWILGYLFRATSGGLGRVAGLAPVELVANVENFDDTEMVDGHMGYRKSIPKLLKRVGFEVFSEEFTEIEDPDPEKQRERQRELQEELNQARKQMEEEATKIEGQSSKKKLFSWLRPKKKEWWENTAGGQEMGEAEAVVNDQSGDVMFDLDAIQEQVDSIRSNQEGSETTVDTEAVVPGTSEKDKAKEQVSKLDEVDVDISVRASPNPPTPAPTPLSVNTIASSRTSADARPSSDDAAGRSTQPN